MFAESIFCPCKSIKTTCLECKEREIDDKNFHLSNPFLFPTNMLLAIQTSSEWAIFAIFYEAEEKGVPWINTSSFVRRHQTAKWKKVYVDTWMAVIHFRLSSSVFATSVYAFTFWISKAVNDFGTKGLFVIIDIQPNLPVCLPACPLKMVINCLTFITLLFVLCNVIAFGYQLTFKCANSTTKSFTWAWTSMNEWFHRDELLQRLKSWNKKVQLIYTVRSVKN